MPATSARLGLPVDRIVYGGMPSNADNHTDLVPLHARLSAAPVVHDAERAARALADLRERCSADAALAELGGLLAASQVEQLLAGVFGASPYLTGLIERNPISLQRALAGPPEQRFAALVQAMQAAIDA